MDERLLELLALFEELGLWEDGVQLIGSWSFLLYQRHLGVRPLPLRTQDVDFLLPWPYPDRGPVDLAGRLTKLGFHSERNSDGSNYFAHPELKLEFLVPERGRGGLEPRMVKPLGMRAISLRFMDMLRKDAIRIQEGDVRVRVPNPLNFCLHKLVIAQRRGGRGKREKDMLQAVYVLEILQPADFKAGLADLARNWRKLAEESLRQAWSLFPLERAVLSKHGLAPQS